MAQYAVTGVNNWEWSQATAWGSYSGGDDNTGPPGEGENVFFDVFTGTAHHFVVDVATELVRSVNMTGYLGTLDVNNALNIGPDRTVTSVLDATIAGSADINCGTSLTVLAGTDFTSFMGALRFTGSSDGAAYLTTNGTSLPHLVVANEITRELHPTDAIDAASFTLVAEARYDDCELAHIIYGDILLAGIIILGSGGTWTQKGSGNVSVASSAELNMLVLGWEQETSTLTGDVYCKNFAHEAGTVVESGTRTLYVSPVGNDFWTSGAGTVTISTVRITLYASRFQATPVVISNIGSLQVRDVGPPYDNYTLTTDDLTLGTGALWIFSHYINKQTTVAVDGDLTCGAVRLGDTAHSPAWGSGKIAFGSGTHTIASLAKYASDGPTGSICDFGSATVNLSDTIDGTDIAFRNTAAKIIGGTLTNVAVDAGDAMLDATQDVFDGGGNSNVNFGIIQVIMHHYRQLRVAQARY